ncbi:MAG: GIDE domain-containing protein, partial [Polyangiaceae bacterium]
MAAMAGVGILVSFIALIVLVFGLLQRTKAKRVADAPFVSTLDAGSRGKEVASPKGAISAQGQVRCDQPVIAPMSGTPSLWYKIKVTASWKDGNENKTRELETQQAAASFSINDGTGEVWIDARKGGDFTPTLSRSETKGAGLIGGLTGQELVFGNHRISPGIMGIGTKYTVSEECLPVENRLYVCGVVGDRSITAPGWRNLLISSKTREELFESATKNAKMMLMGGAGAFAVGLVLSVVGMVFAPPAAAKTV